MLRPTFSERLKYRRYHKYMRRRRKHPISMQDFIVQNRAEPATQTKTPQKTTKTVVLKKKSEKTGE